MSQLPVNWSFYKHWSEPVILLNASGQILESNEPAALLLGLDQNSDSSHLVEIFQDFIRTNAHLTTNHQEKLQQTIREYEIRKSSGQTSLIGLSILQSIEDNANSDLIVLCRDLHVLFQTRNELVKSENRFRDMIQNSSLGLLEVDDQEIIQYANPSFCNLTGYSMDDLKGHHAPTLLIPELSQEEAEKLSKVQEKRKSGISDAYELCIFGKSSQPIWVLISGAPIYDDSGKVKGSMGIHLDITLQKKEADVRLQLLQQIDQRNNTLEHQKQHLTLIYDFAKGLLNKNSSSEIFKWIYQTLPGNLGFTDCIIYHYNSTKAQLEWHPDFINMPDPFPEDIHAEVVVKEGFGVTGIAAEVGQPLWIIDTNLDPRYVPDRQFKNLLDGQIIIDPEYYSVRRSEIAVPIMHKGELLGLIDTGNPNPGYFEQLHLDTLITIANLAAIQLLNVRQKNALTESEGRLRLILDASLDAVFTVDSDHRIKELNQRANELFGYSTGELLGNTIEKLFDSGIHQTLTDLYSVSSEDENRHRFEFIGYKKDSSQFDAEIIISRIFIRGKKFQTLFVRDITTAKRAEFELRSALSKEAELNNLKTRFITMTSHEFRTPLTTIQSSAELMAYLLEPFPAAQSEKFTKYISRISKEVQRLTNLMNDILVLGRIEAGRISLNLEYVDLVAFTTELIRGGHFVVADSRTIELFVSGKPLPVHADPSLLTHIFQNLLSNALKYSPGKKPPMVNLDFMDDRCRISVRDFGIGIPDSEQKNIFQNFFRASNVENIQGTGLGLTIVKQFVELHGGKLFVESSENSGTCMTFELYLEPIR